MARHPRTIYKPVTKVVLTSVDTTAPEIAFFSSIRSVDADASQGLVMKRLELLIGVGLTHTGTLNNTHIVTGFFGFFKWPADAATPTLATIDLQNRTAIFERTLYTVQGTVPRTFRLRAKSVRLRLGEELWCFHVKIAETDTGITSTTDGLSQHWETQA